MFVINFLLDCPRRASGARTAQLSKKMMTNLSENGYIHEFGFRAYECFVKAKLSIQYDTLVFINSNSA